MKTVICLAFFVCTAICVSPAMSAVSVKTTTPGLESGLQFEGSGAISISPLAIDQSPAGISQVDAGRTIRSYLVQFSNTSTPTLSSFSAIIEVTGRILGIQTQLASLRATRFQLDAEPEFDGASPAGGLESNDVVSINGNQISIAGQVGNRGVDPIRIFTAVPEAASIMVWAGLAGIGMIGCPRHRKA